jgi:hypothetical protein
LYFAGTTVNNRYIGIIRSFHQYGTGPSLQTGPGGQGIPFRGVVSPSESGDVIGGRLI